MLTSGFAELHGQDCLSNVMPMDNRLNCIRDHLMRGFARQFVKEKPCTAFQRLFGSLIGLRNSGAATTAQQLSLGRFAMHQDELHTDQPSAAHLQAPGIQLDLLHPR